MTLCDTAAMCRGELLLFLLLGVLLLLLLPSNTFLRLECDLQMPTSLLTATAYTPHVTRHTSHVTHHTSHITHDISPPYLVPHTSHTSTSRPAPYLSWSRNRRDRQALECRTGCTSSSLNTGDTPPTRHNHTSQSHITITRHYHTSPNT